LRKKKNFQKTKKDSIESLSTVIITTDAIIGSKFNAKKQSRFYLFYISKRIKTFNYDDVSRILRTVPGLTIQEEDGFGLRPNIGMRGTSPNRSEKITLMEDGVLITGTILCSCSVLFPNSKQNAIFEILKGGSQIQYGPYTTGGAINMVSTQIPRRFSGRVTSIGSFNTKDLCQYW
jgi:Fe(3+) dicitrate transport protein